MFSRRSESPSLASDSGSFVPHNNQFLNQGGPIVPPRRKKRGRSLSTTQLSSLDGDQNSRYAMPPMNQSLGYDRGKVKQDTK